MLSARVGNPLVRGGSKPRTPPRKEVHMFGLKRRHAAPAFVADRPEDSGLGIAEGLRSATFAAGCFWGLEAAFSRDQGRRQDHSRLYGRADFESNLRARLRSWHGTRRGGRGLVRLLEAQLRRAGGVVLGDPQPDDTQPPGPGHRQPVPLGDLRPRRRPGQRVACRAPEAAAQGDRHRDRARGRHSGRRRSITSATSRSRAAPRAPSPSGGRDPGL